MSCSKFKEYKGLDLSQVNSGVLQAWDSNDTFHKSLETRSGHPRFIFTKGLHRQTEFPEFTTLWPEPLRMYLRYKTQKGFFVERKAGWDTMGFPVELGVEKMLGYYQGGHWNKNIGGGV